MQPFVSFECPLTIYNDINKANKLNCVKNLLSNKGIVSLTVIQSLARLTVSTYSLLGIRTEPLTIALLTYQL